MISCKCYKLNWDLYDNLYVFPTIGDGSCFFHSILHIVEGYEELSTYEKIKITKKFRKYLSEKLVENYDTLSRSNLKNFELEEFKLENMVIELNSNTAVDNKYNELISNILNIDIYLLDSGKQSLYITGKDADILLKKRDSVVILYTHGHYEIIGSLDYDGKFIILYDHEHEFIQKLYKMSL